MSIFKSKKFQALLIGIVVVAIGCFLPDAQAQVEEIVKLVMIYMGAQGAADFMKEKAKVEVE